MKMYQFFISIYLIHQIHVAYLDQEPIKGGYSPYAYQDTLMLIQPEMYVSGSLSSQNWNGMETSGVAFPENRTV